jgi:hypothetical protein
MRTPFCAPVLRIYIGAATTCPDVKMQPGQEAAASDSYICDNVIRCQ